MSLPLERREGQLEIVRFSDESREGLIREGYTAFVPLTGQSIQSLRRAGYTFWTDWHRAYPDFEALKSRLSEVAFNPDRLFLPDSNDKILQEQLAMVAELSVDLSRNIPGVKAIIGEAPGYAELAFRYFETTGIRLFGKHYDYECARTVTRIGGPSVADVGDFGTTYGLGVSIWYSDGGLRELWAAPLVVPL